MMRSWIARVSAANAFAVAGAVACAVAGVLAAAPTAQEEPRYPGIGPGHYVTAVREDGRFVTLEDKSQWEIAEADRHKTIAWQELEGISIRYAGGTDEYRYEIDDIDRDEGASARWVRPQK